MHTVASNVDPDTKAQDPETRTLCVLCLSLVSLSRGGSENRNGHGADPAEKVRNWAAVCRVTFEADTAANGAFRSSAPGALTKE